MPTLNKETKNKGSISKMQLTTEQRVFVVKTYYKTISYLEVKEAFRRTFSENDPPTNRTIWKNVKKYEREATSLNINKRRSGRKRTVRTKGKMEVCMWKVMLEMSVAGVMDLD